MRKIFSLFLLLSLLLLPSCAPADGFDAGRPITPEELADISAELFTAADAPEDTPDESSDGEGVGRDPNTVYWTEGGSVYHRDPNCSHLKNAVSVKSGAVLTAQMDGKERVCSSCGGE
jgi:hypothetical protein